MLTGSKKDLADENFITFATAISSDGMSGGPACRFESSLLSAFWNSAGLHQKKKNATQKDKSLIDAAFGMFCVLSGMSGGWTMDR